MIRIDSEWFGTNVLNVTQVAILMNAKEYKQLLINQFVIKYIVGLKDI